jgi:hypothetical protein
VYNFDDRKVPPKGFRGRCKKCGNSIVIKPQKIFKSGPNENRHEIKEKEKAPSETGSHNLFNKPGKNDSVFANAKKQRNQTEIFPKNLSIDYILEKISSSVDISSLNKRKLIVCSILFFMILLIQFNFARDLMFEGHIFYAIDDGAEQVIDDNMKRALYSFTIARGINAVISVIQDSQLTIEPAGLGVSLAIGEVLDPVNDLIERFSWIILLSLISLGIMKILINISSWLSIDLFLSFGLFFILIGMFLKKDKRKIFFSAAKKALLGALIIRFAIPVVAHLNSKVYHSVLDSEYSVATGELERSSRELNIVNENMQQTLDSEETSGWLAKLKNAKNSLSKIVDLKGKINSIKNVALNMADTLIKLSVVFLLNTIILPLAFLWLFVKISRMFFGSHFALNLEQRFRRKIFPDENIQPIEAGAV